MLHKWNRFLSFLLAIALVTTTFGSDFATARAYAVEGIETDLSSEDDGMADLSFAEEVTESNEESAQEVTDVTESTETTEEVVEEPTTTDETQEEITDEETTEEEEEEASEEEITDETEVKEPEEEETVVKEKLVKVTYKAGKGGRVSTSSEEVDINKEDAAFEGSTATAWNDKYTFVDWTDEDGNQVSTEATFVPSDVTEDATFTANFLAAEDIETAMPAISADNVKAGDMIVSVSADAGLFPEGTEIVISAVDDGTALELAQEVKENATQAKAVDIKFVKDEQELQPADSKYVHVSLALDQTIEGDDFSVLHQHDGEVKEISADVDTHTEVVDGDETTVATAAEFKVNEFSIFIISNDGDSSTDTDAGRAVATYNFYKKDIDAADNEAIFSKLVKKDDVIANPGVPTVGENQEFIGWYVDGDMTKEHIEFTNDEYTVGTVAQGDVVNVYPVFRTTYYITYIGKDGEIAHVEQFIVEGDSNKSFDLSVYDSYTAPAGRALKGWSTVKDDASKITDKIEDVTAVDEVDGSIHVYAIVVDAYWVRFVGNTAGVKGSTYTGPVFVEENETLGDALAKVTTEPERTGYTFGGWSFENEWDNTALSETDLATKIQDVATLDKTKRELYLYAKWVANDDASFNIIVWYENLAGNGYDYGFSEKIDGVTTGTGIHFYDDDNQDLIGVATDDSQYYRWYTRDSDIKTGFEYNSQNGSKYEIHDGKGNDTTVVGAAGDTTVNIYLQRKDIEIILYAPTGYSRGNGYSGSEYNIGKSGNNYFRIYYHQASSWRDSSYWYYIGTDGNAHYYNGDRYKVSSWKVHRTFTGRYGTTLNDNGFTWPTDYAWFPNQDGTGTRQTLKDAFLDDEKYYGYPVGSVSGHIYHYQQNVDGTWSLSSPAASIDSTGGTLYFENKFNGFTVYKYLSGSSITNNNVEDWNDCTSSGGAIDPNIYVAHKRNTYTLTLRVYDPVSGNYTDTDVDGIYYQQKLADNAKVKPYIVDGYAPANKAGYTFAWYKSPEGDIDGQGTNKFDFANTTMPDGGIVVYGVYTPVKYQVKLHSEGGKFVNELAPGEGEDPDTDIISFNVKSTEEVDRNNLITGVAREGYELIGWYYADNTEFKYGRITKNVELYAHWRYEGVVKVVYKAAPHGSFSADTSNNEYIPAYNYSTDSSVVAYAPPSNIINDEDKNYTFIGWKVKGGDGTVLLPNNVFTIDTDIIDAGEVRGGVRYVVVEAQYKETGIEGGEDEYTSITYHPNGGVPLDGVVVDAQGLYVVTGVKVNASVTAERQLFKKAGERFVSWNTMPDGSGLNVDPGKQFIAADKKDRPNNSSANILYAQYVPVTLTVKVAGTSLETAYTGSKQSNPDFAFVSASYKDENGNDVYVDDFTKANVKYNGTGAEGTEVLRDADGNVIAYEQPLAYDDFEPQNTNYTDVHFVVDDTNSKILLKIKPVTLTITTGSGEKEYDGTALTNPSASVDGFVGNDSATITATGSQIEVGSSTNSYKWNEEGIDALLNNYTLDEQLGTLTVKTNESTEITITAASDSKTYDGTALTNSRATASGLPTGFTVVASASGSQTDAGTSANVVNDGYVIKNAAGQDKTANFTKVKTVDGTLTVNKAEYRVVTQSAAKPYDGTALTMTTGATITGLVNDETATVVPNGTITEVGSTPNTYDISWGTAKASNYKLAENGETLGTLTVSKAKITLRADSKDKDYDGTPLTSNKIHIGGGKTLPTGYEIVGTCEGSITNAGSTPNVVKTWDIVDADGNSKKDQFDLVETIDGTLTVNKVTVTITTGSASKVYDGTALKNSQAGISGLVNNESSVVTVTATGEQTDVGSSDNTYSIDWGTAKAGNYTIKEKLGTLEVTKNAVAITLTAGSGEKTYDGTALTNATVTATGLPTGITTNAVASGSQTDAGSSDNTVVSGYKFYKGTQDVTKNFTNVTEVTGTLKVNQAPATITTGSGSKAYDGTALKVATAGISGLVSTDSATVTATGSQTEVGSSDNTYSIVWNSGKAANYNITEKLGTLEITANSDEVKLTAASDSKTYDGTALTNAGVTPSGLPEGFTVEATASGSQTDAGESANVVNDGYVIKNAAGEDKTASFTNVKKVDGKLTVSQAPVTIKTGSDSKAYDGTALTNDEAGITGLVNNESAKVTATGSQTEVGSSSNTYSIEWTSGKAANYNITEELGTLTITANANAVTLTAPSDSKTYDGTALTADGTGEKKVTATGLPEGFTVEATASGSQTNAGSSANTVNDGYVIKNAAGEDKTANFTSITKANGTLTVEKATVTVTTGTASKAYDGTALTNDEAGITGLKNGETAIVTATGSQTEVGSSSNTYTINWKTASADNYTVSESLGTLTVTQNADEVTLTAATASKTYDGQPLTDSTVTATGLPEGFTYEATASGSQTNYGSSANKVNNGYKFFDANGKDKTSNFTNVTKVDGTLTVNQKDVTITTGGGSKEYDGTALTVNVANIEGLENNETATVTATGSQTEVGSSDNTYSINWGTTDKNNYNVIESLGTLEVTENTTTKVTLTAASGSKTYDGTALTKNEVTPSGLPEGFTVEATASGSQTDAGENANVVDDGYVIKNAAGEDKTANFKTVEKVDGTLTVNKATVTITTGSGEKEYDGTALKNSEAGITGLVNGETATVTATGEQIEVGSSSNTYSIKWVTAKAGNYTVSEELGTLKVTASSKTVTLTAGSGEKTYDGTALTNSSVDVTGLPDDFTYEATASGSQTDAGESANTVNDGYKFFDADGNDKTANFTSVSKVDGTLTVNKAPVTISTGSGRKAYDGTALTNAEAGIEATGTPSKAVTDQIATVTVTATGSQTNIGTSTNSYDIDWANVNKDNYEITKDLGTLEVYANNAAVTLTAASASKTYDGSALTKNEVTYTGLPAGIKVRATASGSQTDAASSANTVTFYEFYVPAAEGTAETIVPAGYFTNVQTVDGTLTVNKAKLTVTTGSDEKEYDGTALTKDEAGLDGLVNNETATVTATGEQIEVGSSSNTYSITWGTAKAGNYEIAEELGTLTVTAHNTTVTLTAASDSKTYDGTALTNSGVTPDGLPEGFTVEATASGSQTDAGSSANVVNDGYVIKNAAGVDKTANFPNVSKVDGTLTVDKATLTVTTGSDSKKYDGTALTKDEASLSGLKNKETATVTATGSQTEVGSSDNTYSIEWGTAKADNYEIDEKLGTLTVTKNDGTVTLIAASDSKTYDGSALTNSGVTVTGLPDGFTYKATASGSQLNAGTSANTVDDGYQFFDAEGNDKTANFTTVEKTDGTLTVNPVAVKITTESDKKAYDGTPLTNNGATIEAIGDVNATVETQLKSVAIKATGSQTEVGSSSNPYSITSWGQATAGNYSIEDENVFLGTLEVTGNNAEVKLIAGSGNKVYDGKELTNSKVSATGLPDDFTIEATASGSQLNVGSSANVVDDGYVILYKGEDKTENFTNVSKVNGTLEVTKASVTISTGSGKKAYDGTPLTKNEANIDGLADGESVTLKATGTITEVGTAQNTYTIKWDKATESNYDVTEELGTLEITKNSKEIKLTAASDKKVYDGKELKNDEVTAEGLPEGFTVKATATGSQKNYGTSANVVDDDYQILYKGEDKTENFTNIVPVAGELEVTKAPLTIKTNTKSKKYDGTPLTAGAVVETSEKTNKIDDDHDDQAITVTLINGETATITLANKLTKVDKIDNTYAIAWGETIADNYDLKEEIGTLEVTDRGDDAFVVYASVEDVTVTYNGTEWKNFDYSLSSKKATILDNIIDFFSNLAGFISYADMDETTVTEITPIDGGATFKVTGVKVSTAQTDAGTYTMAMDFSNASVKDPEGNEVKDQFTFVEDKMGNLVIEPAPLTVTTGSASRTFNNQPLTNSEANLTGLVEGEEATVVATGSQTAVGSSRNTYQITWVTAKESNYKIIENLGTLTVNAVPSTPSTPSDPTPIPDDPTPTAAAPAGVLGARREDALTDGAAVLGARRGRTEDEANTNARVFAIVMAVAAAITTLIAGKKKEEEED